MGVSRYGVIVDTIHMNSFIMMRWLMLVVNKILSAVKKLKAMLESDFFVLDRFKTLCNC